MALVTVQRSPTPSTTSSPSVSESGSGEDDRRSQPRRLESIQESTDMLLHICETYKALQHLAIDIHESLCFVSLLLLWFAELHRYTGIQTTGERCDHIRLPIDNCATLENSQNIKQAFYKHSNEA
ncbi:hypothetical protein ABVT39_004073 [Epinephelus coioides]